MRGLYEHLSGVEDGCVVIEESIRLLHHDMCSTCVVLQSRGA